MLTKQIWQNEALSIDIVDDGDKKWLRGALPLFGLICTAVGGDQNGMDNLPLRYDSTSED